MHDQLDVIIIGGGLAGLVCARKLSEAGFSCRLLEASDDIGGRVRTDEVDGFLLDRGFQVFLTAYPEAKTVLDYDDLDLCPFEPGAISWFGGRFHRMSDPWRRPQHVLATAFSSSATLADKLRIAKFRKDTIKASLDEIYDRNEQPTIELLRERGFSEVIIERFFRPFLGGVFLDGELQTSSRMCEFVFRMFSLGDAAIPRNGMRAIPKQLASQLPADVIRTNATVAAIHKQQVVLQSGEQLFARAIVVATAAPRARKLLGDSRPAEGRSVNCLYFASPEPLIKEPILALNGDGNGPINNLCVPSQVSPNYAPKNQSLISVTVLGQRNGDNALQTEVLSQLERWFGPIATSLRHLKTYHISYALPAQPPPALQPVAKATRHDSGVFVCGDHCDTGSINGAMASGRRTAKSVIATLQKTD